MEGGIKRPGECSDIEESFVLGKKIKKEIINLTEENVSVSHGIEGDRVRTEDIQEHEVGRTLRHVENGSVNTLGCFAGKVFSRHSRNTRKYVGQRNHTQRTFSN